ncbi:HisA/HisF-related TIM barrel protein [Treponema endosymbiont of Eucomonympha sp.]|uniref:HisA/HisF-related TIM barrel protein n=2 Tax=Treponema endosymbiont of Eucomonympha sp. TaxID=1580831 RepID=UPI00078507F0|nr:HisA/HisF-related TIM barrel protein [Treponema endosymbiont of Eucomonympha sp.]
MVIASIDLKGGKVVQLKNGKDLMLERDNPDALIEEFSVYGETAVIDLDAALGNALQDGETANAGILKRLLRKGNVRAGGGVRSAAKAKELVSLGAEKVIVGSQAFLPAGRHGAAGVLNTAFLGELERAVGRQRVIISVDALHGDIAVKGWTETTGIRLLDGAREAEKHCSELLFTCVEREGCMKGTDLSLVKELRAVVDCRLVAAGGVASVTEIAELEQCGCDVQLGMALYTGAVSLKDAFIECLNWEKVPLVPVIAQSPAGEVLMMGYANREAFHKSFDTKKLTFWSRTRNVLWTKGLHSGKYLGIVRLRADCDRDTVLATVVPHGEVCHTGSWTCFSSEPDESPTLDWLYRVNPKSCGAETIARLDQFCEGGAGGEQPESNGGFVPRCADMLDALTSFMRKEDIAWKDVFNELDRRRKQ